MDKKSLKQYAIGGISILLLGGAVINSSTDDTAEMTISYQQSSTSTIQTQQQHSHIEAVITDTLPETTDITVITATSPQYQSEASDIDTAAVTTTAASDTAPPKESADTAFSDSADTDVAEKPQPRTTSKSNHAAASATLPDAYIVTTSSTADSIPETDVISVTVYVSNSGKYHANPKCSGMKYYTEMSMTQAKVEGHAACKKCY